MAILSNGKFSGFLCSIKDTGRKLKNGAAVMIEDFLSGFNGYGWKLWKKDGAWKLEIDELLVRRSFTTFEHIISQITSIKGGLNISQGHAKIKAVTTVEADVYKEVDGVETITKAPCYRLEIDDESNSIVEYDFVQCLKNGRHYLVQVGSVFQYYINIPVSEFDSDPDTGAVLNAPQAGDEIVQFGNASHQEKYKNRHSAIYLHLDENEPAIDLMTDMYSKDWSNAIKTRIGGNLPGTDGDRGFYAVNGKLLSVDEQGQTVYEINPDGSGYFARGKFSWTKDGSPKFSGTILVRLSNNNVWEVTEDGLNIFGNKQGKRIEISSSNSTLNIFDENNDIVNTFEGNSYNNISDLYNGELPTITASTKSFIVTNANSSHTEVIKEETFHAINEQIIYCSIPIQITISWDYVSQNYLGSDNSGIGRNGYELHLIKYESVNGAILSDEIISSNTYFMPGTNTYSFTNYIINIAEKGYYALDFKINTKATAVNTPVLIEATVEGIEITAKRSGYLSRFFANGMALGDSEANLFSVFNKKTGNETYIEFIANNNLAGIYVKRDRLLGKSTILPGTIPCWGVIPKMVFAMGVTIQSTNTLSTELYFTFDNAMVTTELESHPTYKIVTFKYPSAWTDYKFSKNSFLLIQPYKKGLSQASSVVINAENDINCSVFVNTGQEYSTEIFRVILCLY